MKYPKCIMFLALMAFSFMPLLSIACEEEHPLEELYLDTLNSDQVYLGGQQLLIPAYAELFIETPIVTEMTTAGIYYLVQGTTVTEEIKGFTSNGAGRLTYTDITENRVALVTASLSSWLPGEDTPAIIAYRMFINGEGDLASTTADVISIGDSLDAMQMVSLVSLQPNDYLEIKVVSNVANCSLNVITMSLTITTVD